ncbi:hypothetical protein D7Z54_22020 [Salibacterium salarium]|uniref:PucR C-terminal helix-turn-helix domain-containing protein n=1 Tax=Salibacterium salarium TaxID=284579 RepID=A0A428MYF3_9BACI|nr:helix-turn-helix domain-containing protein [Salibacterium salarium]RSL31188.1 hypothetical protein D7Z54_22020 [Salibacterium salarium]
MIDKLQKVFPSAILEDDVPKDERHLYNIYTANDYQQHRFALKKEELTEKDEQLLEVFLAVEKKDNYLKPGDYEWYTYLKEGGHPPKTLEQFSTFRFFHLEGKKLQENHSDLYEALSYYFNENVKIVYIQTNSLLILVPDQDADMFDPEELAGILTTDLLLDVFIFAGRRVHKGEDIRTTYNQENLLFQRARALFPKKRTFKEYESLPFILPLLEKHQQKQIYHYAFAGLETESELIDTLYQFFLCNLNSSLTAKTLHMHRNTLQYRIDKLMDRTGIDIKQFSNAAALYILIHTSKNY